MKYSKKATSIIEAMIVLMLVVTGVTGMYGVYGSSQKLSISTGNKIQAIQIAREGIEGIKNIRNTNWIKFGSDIPNCWNTFDYNNDCVNNAGGSDTATDISGNINDSFQIYKSSDNSWKLSVQDNTGDFSNTAYRNNFKVMIDSDGFYTQTGSFANTRPLFTRELKIRYLEEDGSPGDSNDPKMEVRSLVQWVDSSSSTTHNVEFTTLLTNWKK